MLLSTKLLHFFFIFYKTNNQTEQNCIYNSEQNILYTNKRWVQASRILFPTCESFGQSVADAFNKGSSKVKVLYWACCLESHQNGRNHYHCSVKLPGPKRWKSVKVTSKKDSGIQVHFSDAHNNYWIAFKCITKSDPNILLSSSHPNILTS